MLGKEQLHVLGFPCWAKGAAAARVEPWLAKSNPNIVGDIWFEIWGF